MMRHGHSRALGYVMGLYYQKRAIYPVDLDCKMGDLFQESYMLVPPRNDAAEDHSEGSMIIYKKEMEKWYIMK